MTPSPGESVQSLPAVVVKSGLRCVCGLDGWDDFSGIRGRFYIEMLGEVFEERGGGGLGDGMELGRKGFFGGCGFVCFGWNFCFCCRFDLRLWATAAGDVNGGYLEAEEEETGAAGIDVVEGEGGEYFAEGVLDVGAGARLGNGEATAAGVAGLRVGAGFAGLVVVVAVLLVA